MDQAETSMSITLSHRDAAASAAKSTRWCLSPTCTQHCHGPSQQACLHMLPAEARQHSRSWALLQAGVMSLAIAHLRSPCPCWLQKLSGSSRPFPSATLISCGVCRVGRAFASTTLISRGRFSTAYSSDELVRKAAKRLGDAVNPEKNRSAIDLSVAVGYCQCGFGPDCFNEVCFEILLFIFN